MSKNENPFLNWLAIRPTPESELRLELESREILNSENVQEVKFLCASLYKENWAKDQLIKSCLARIGELEGQLIVCRRQKRKLFLLTLFRKVLRPKKPRSSEG